MKTTALLVAVLFSSLTAHAALPELTGIYVEEGRALFVLADSATGESSRWLGLGQEFEGYLLKEFQSAADTIILGKDDADHPIKLRSAKVKYAATTLSGTIEIGAGRSVRVQRATLIFGSETNFPTSDDVSLTIRPVLLGDGNIAYYTRFERTGPDGNREVLAAPTVVSLPGKQFSMRLGDLGFSLKP